jgi:phenylpyruvate tautomerase PptA (4-oxalocrotonate tautomerase family)
MPAVNVEWLEGRSAEVKREMAGFIADTIAEADHIGKERVMVMFTDYPKDGISRGGQFADD